MLVDWVTTLKAQRAGAMTGKASAISALEFQACELLAPCATLGLSPCARPLHISHKLRSQGPGTLELDQIAPNYALRQMMEEWITGHESHSVA